MLVPGETDLFRQVFDFGYMLFSSMLLSLIEEFPIYDFDLLDLCRDINGLSDELLKLWYPYRFTPNKIK